jgi:hypothetical protein
MKVEILRREPSRRLAFAVLNLRHFGKKFGANAGRRRLVLAAQRRLARVVAIGRRADQGGHLVIINRRLCGGRAWLIQRECPA